MLRKFLNITLLILLFAFFTSNFTFANTIDKETVVVGYETGYGIIDDINSIDKKGYGYDLLKKMEEYSNLEFEFKSFEFTDGLEALENGEIDVFGPVSYTEERGEKFTFTENVFLREQTILASPNTEYDCFYNDPLSIDGKNISLYTGATSNDDLEEYAKENGITYNPLYSNISSEFYFREDADLYLVTSLNTFLDYKTILNVGASDLFLITNKENTELANKLDSAYNEMIIREMPIVSSLYLDYYAKSELNNRSLSREESQAVRNATLKVGYSIGDTPIQYQNELLEPSGVSVDVIKHLAEMHGFNVEFYPYDPNIGDSGDIQYDILLYSNDLDTSKYISLAPYITLPLMLVGEEESLLSPNKIGVPSDASYDYSEIRELYPNSQIIGYSHLDKLKQEYFEGNIDAVLLNEVSAYYSLSIFDEDVILKGTSIEYPLRFYISSDLSKELLTAFDIMVNRIDIGYVNEIIAKESAVNTNEYALSDIIENHYYEIIAIVLLSVSALFIFLFSFQLKKRKEVSYIANHDDVTGLISIQKFRDSAKHILENSVPSEYEIITMDIDYFRIINNIFGYETGTSVIKAVSNELKNAFGSHETLISRITSDQFIILRKSNNDKSISDICKNNLSTAVKDILGKGYNLAISVGIYIVDDNKAPINLLIDRANVARNKGKEFHKNTYIYFDEDMKKDFETRTQIVFNMETALKNKEFYLLYQPKIDFKTLRVDGAEALVRWKTRTGKTIYPNEFIPVFEANGFSAMLDLYVFERVCEFIYENKDKIDIPRISVNLSGKTINKPNLAYKLKQTLSEYELDTSVIELEVTESALIDNSIAFLNSVDFLRQEGFIVSMDDFGAGASSLNRLHSLDVDIVKLDKVFLDSNSNHKKGDIIMKSVIDMVQDLNMKVVCEGVETKEQVLWLQRLNCDIAQGYYFERPLEVDDFLEILKTDKQYKIL